jgi:hypothetical protein
MRYDVPHGCDNYEVLTLERQATIDMLTRQAIALVERCMLEGFVINITPSPVFPPRMGVSDLHIDLRPARFLATTTTPHETSLPDLPLRP